MYMYLIYICSIVIGSSVSPWKSCYEYDSQENIFSQNHEGDNRFKKFVTNYLQRQKWLK